MGRKVSVVYYYFTGISRIFCFSKFFYSDQIMSFDLIRSETKFYFFETVLKSESPTFVGIMHIVFYGRMYIFFGRLRLNVFSSMRC